MKPVFLDTVGLIAIWDVGDQWHASATLAWNRLVAENADFYSTTYVLAECGNSAARRPFRDAPARLREQLETWETLMVPTRQDWTSAWAAYGRGEAGNAGIVDQLSFVVMRRLGLTRVFTNDRHFSAAGFEVLF